MKRPYIGFTPRMKIAGAGDLDALDAIVNDLAARCGLPMLQPGEDYRSLVERVRPLSERAAEHIEFAIERKEAL